jgi:NAD-dependent dihydropyrimidine dehydrogenase PreA subunit
MAEDDSAYRNLQRHLDGQVLRFAPHKSGADIRILKSIFTPEEARVATRLTHRFETPEEIHDRASDLVDSREELQQLLDSAVQKGGLGYTEREGKGYYKNLPLIIGIFEACIHRLTPELLKDLREMSANSPLSFGLSFMSTEPSQFRTIPIEHSITPEHHVAEYDELRKLIEDTEGPIVVLECVCRKAKSIEGAPCKKTSREEVCLTFENAAQMWLKKGYGRQITRDDAMEIARQNQQEGLVLNTSNSRKIEFICGCCDCCCGLVHDIAKMPRPGHFFQHNYYSQIDSSLCTACRACVEACPMSALEIKAKRKTAAVDLHRCIGCGVCVPRCKFGAISMKRKETDAVPPETEDDLYDTIMANRRGTLASVARFVGKMFKDPRN